MAAQRPRLTWSKISGTYRNTLSNKGSQAGLSPKQIRDRYNRGTLTVGINRALGTGVDATSGAMARKASYLSQKIERGEELTDQEIQDYTEGKKKWYHN
jgi:hypothetical protein